VITQKNETKSKKQTASTISLIGTHVINDGFTDMLNPILSTMASYLSFSISMVSGLATSMNATNLLFKIPSGIILNVTRKDRLLLTIGLLIQALGFLVLSFLDNYLAMVLAMAFVGIGWSMYHPASYSLIALFFDKNKRTFLTSLFNISGSLGPVIYVSAVGVLTTLYGWRVALQIICIVSIIISLIIHLTLPGKVRIASKSSRKSEIKVSTMIKEILKNKTFISVCLMGSFRGLAHRGITVFLPLFLGVKMGLRPTEIGFIYSSMVIAGIFGQAAVGYFGDRLGITRVLLGILIVASISTGLISILGNITLIVALILLLGFCNYSVRPIMWSFAMSHSKEESMSLSLSIMDFANQTLSAFSPLIGGIIADLWGVQVTIFSYAVIYLFAALVAVFMNRMARGRE